MIPRARHACLGACVWALAGGAFAQPDFIETCRQTPTDAARIACLEAALAEVLGGERKDRAEGTPMPREAAPAEAPATDGGEQPAAGLTAAVRPAALAETIQ